MRPRDSEQLTCILAFHSQDTMQKSKEHINSTETETNQLATNGMDRKCLNFSCDCWHPPESAKHKKSGNSAKLSLHAWRNQQQLKKESKERHKTRQNNSPVKRHWKIEMYVSANRICTWTNGWIYGLETDYGKNREKSSRNHFTIRLCRNTSASIQIWSGNGPSSSWVVL